MDERFKFYYEARARRNLLAHRGRKPDQIYYDELKRNNIDKKFQKRIFSIGLFKYSTSRANRLGDEKDKNDVNNPNDLSVTPHYLTFICSNIIFITQSLLMDVGDEDLDFDLHDFLKQSIANKNKKLLKMYFEILEEDFTSL